MKLYLKDTFHVQLEWFTIDTNMRGSNQSTFLFCAGDETTEEEHLPS